MSYNIVARAKCLVSNPTDIKGNAESVGGWRASHNVALRITEIDCSIPTCK